MLVAPTWRLFLFDRWGFPKIRDTILGGSIIESIARVSLFFETTRSTQCSCDGLTQWVIREGG